MILLVHMLFGAAVGTAISNPWLALIGAFLGHYFLDLFPHIEYLDGVENTITALKKVRLSQNAKNMIMVFLDFCLGLAIIFLVSKNQPILYLCAFMAIVPDGLTIVHSLFPKLGLGLHHHLHGTKIHYLTKQKKFPVFWRIATQVIFAILSIVILRP